MHVCPDDRYEWNQPESPWMLATFHDEEERHGKQRHRDELGPQRQRGRGHDECAEGEPRGTTRLQTSAVAKEEDDSENDPDQGRTQDGKPNPPADQVCGFQENLGAPLLIEPREPGRSEGPGIE